MYSKADLLQIQSEIAPISYVVYYIYVRNEPRQDYFDNYFRYTFVIDKPEKPVRNGLPPMYIAAMALDPLKDDSIKLANQLQQQGQEYYLSIWLASSIVMKNSFDSRI